MEMCTGDEVRKMQRLYAFKGKRKVTMYDALEWLRSRGFYVMVMPRPYYLWKVWICVLGKPNTQDGKLNGICLDPSFESIADAQHYALDTQLDILINAEEKASGMTEEEKDALLEECRKKGWDV